MQKYLTPCKNIWQTVIMYSDNCTVYTQP